MNRVSAMMLAILLAFGVDAGAEYARSRQGSSSGASANVPSATGDEFVKACLKQTFSVSQLRYAHNATDIKRRLSDNSEPTRQDVDARFLNGLRHIGSSRLQKQISSNCEHFDADIQKLKQAQDKVNKCKERQSLEITAPTIEEIRRAKKEASEKQQPYKEPGPKCSKSDKKECKQALEELKKAGSKPSEATNSAQLHPKLDGSLGLGSRAGQNAQQRQIDQHQQAAKAKCQDEIDKANLENGLLRHLGDDEPTSASLEKARKACAQDAQKNQQALDKLEINPQSRASLALLANTSLANEYLRDHPEGCESYQRLRAELERIAVRENIPAAALAGGTALGCALNPAICGVLSAGAGLRASIHNVAVANELERQAATIRASGGPESEVKRLLREAEDKRREVALELAIGLVPGVAKAGRRVFQDAGETSARHANDLPTNIAAGDSATHPPFAFSDKLFEKVRVHLGWSPSQSDYVKSIMPEVNRALEDLKRKAAREGREVTADEVNQRLAFWFQAPSPKSARDPRLLEDESLRPLRPGKPTSIFPDGVSPQLIAKEIKEGASIKKVESSKNVIPGQMLYNYNRSGSTYQIFVCSQPVCRAGGKEYAEGQVTSVFPCGENVRVLLPLSKAMEAMAKASGPVSPAIFYQVGSKCVH